MPADLWLRTRLLPTLLLLYAPTSVHAQTDTAVSVRPSAGLWWSPNENGHFMQLAIGPGGYVLATLTEADGFGQPTYRVLQGPYEASDARSGEGLGRVSSNFYRVVDSTCLECGPADGRTLDTGVAGVLRFLDGTHAELLDRSQVLRRYELFPLLTDARQTTAERVAGQRFMLSVAGASEVVTLRPLDASVACESPDLLGARNFRLEFERPESALGGRYADVRVQIAPGVNPRIAVKLDVPLYQRYCVLPGSFFTCQAYEIRPSGRTRCAPAYTLHEAGDTLRGGAMPGAGSGLLFEFDGTYTPYTPARFSGALTLQRLPID